eukprot:CAMPEP_0168430140 /NCGR_PEP_ID=MMETSP0228-20121227/37730_1 /TAXON_ID=133427 /ORGANISM="Protoceratium reticulatum, Strain CCCM 535 (=CCMP 1889)" /LENGTH=164 /DNA_ID=CAMNT_0008444243 /DNA_START=6 /DNA_END=497 /DNA_ORIENTATION=+
MAARLRGTSPGQMRQTPSPKRTPSPRKQKELNPDQLLAELERLQKFKVEEEKQKKKDEQQKKKDLTAAKKKIAKEVQSASKTFKKHNQDVVKLEQTLKKIEGQETDVKKKTMQSEEKFKDKLHLAEQKHSQTELRLLQKHEEAVQERAKLQKLECVQDILVSMG